MRLGEFLGEGDVVVSADQGFWENFQFASIFGLDESFDIEFVGGHQIDSAFQELLNILFISFGCVIDLSKLLSFVDHDLSAGRGTYRVCNVNQRFSVETDFAADSSNEDDAGETESLFTIDELILHRKVGKFAVKVQVSGADHGIDHTVFDECLTAFPGKGFVAEFDAESFSHFLESDLHVSRVHGIGGCEGKPRAFVDAGLYLPGCCMQFQGAACKEKR